MVVLWTGRTTPYPVWENEFFNRSVRTVYDLDGAPLPDPLPETPATRVGQRSGRERRASARRPLRARRRLGRRSPGASSRETRSVSSSTASTDRSSCLPASSGLYPLDTWSGATATYQRVECTGGSLAVELESDPALFRTVQTVVAHEGGRVVGEAHVSPTGESVLRVPLTPAGGRCTVRFTVAHIAVPARVEPGSTDARRLGVHFLTFSYRP